MAMQRAVVNDHVSKLDGEPEEEEERHTMCINVKKNVKKKWWAKRREDKRERIKGE